MTLAAGFESNLLTGLAVHMSRSYVPFPILLGRGLSLLASWKPTGAYTALQTGIVLGAIPQTPDRIITLSAYGVSNSPSLSTSVLGVQVRCRWGGQDKRPVDDLTDAIFDFLHNSQHLILSTGVHIVRLELASGPASLGQDANNRWSTVSNYYATTHRPSTHRT